MSIRTKLLIFALSISLIPISIITTLYYFNARSTIERQTLDWLTAVAESKKVHTLSFLDSKKGRVIDFSSDGFIRDSLEAISSSETQSPVVNTLIRHLEVNKKPLDRHITAIAVLDINGNVVASTNKLWLGKDMSKATIFMSCVTKNYGETYIGKSYSVPYLKENCIFISAPLTSRQEHKTMGVIINAYDIAILDEITTKRAGMGESGEALLGMRKGDSVVFLTTLKYAPDMPLSKSVPLNSSGAKPMRLALEGQSGAIIAPDYRNIDVVAAYQYIPEMNWGMVTKIDKREVFALITRLRIFTIILGCISAIVVIAIAIIVSKRVTKPIQKLVEGTKRIASGDLGFKIPTRSKDEIGFLAASFNDMTSQLGESKKQVEDYAQNLEQKVEDKTKEVKHMLVELTYKNKEMEQIIYVTSHDLRSPLLNIQGFSRELQQSFEQVLPVLNESGISPETREKLADALEEDIPDALKFILASSSKMDTLLSGLLRISRMGRVVLAIKQLDMNKLISNIIGTYEYMIKEEKVKVQVGELPSCKGDNAQINQVFSNLLDNALKYLDSDREGIIRISGENKNGHIVYCLEDNGIGIVERQQTKVFEIFHRLNPAGNDVAGEGLGLTIISKILDRHGGKIWIESEPGKGSKFFVSLPA
ncbi:MAG: ATP-binding protein [Candidatus Scalindua sp.]